MIHATIQWQGQSESFLKGTYSRKHTWQFDGGVKVDASSSPEIVPEPLSDPSAVDPEEAYVASISSCHMLWFLAIAAKSGFEVRSYRDEALGEMKKNPAGKLFIASIKLRPEIDWAREPTDDQIRQMHHQAHDECFIANSVQTKIEVEIK